MAEGRRLRRAPHRLVRRPRCQRRSHRTQALTSDELRDDLASIAALTTRQRNVCLRCRCGKPRPRPGQQPPRRPWSPSRGNHQRTRWLADAEADHGRADTSAESTGARARRRSCGREGVDAGGPRRGQGARPSKNCVRAGGAGHGPQTEPAESEAVSADRTRPPPAKGPPNTRRVTALVVALDQRQQAVVVGAAGGARVRCRPTPGNRARRPRPPSSAST